MEKEWGGPHNTCLLCGGKLGMMGHDPTCAISVLRAQLADASATLASEKAHTEKWMDAATQCGFQFTEMEIKCRGLESKLKEAVEALEKAANWIGKLAPGCKDGHDHTEHFFAQELKQTLARLRG